MEVPLLDHSSKLKFGATPHSGPVVRHEHKLFAAVRLFEETL
jgi:hypothetical protein